MQQLYHYVVTDHILGFMWSGDFVFSKAEINQSSINTAVTGKIGTFGI